MATTLAEVLRHFGQDDLRTHGLSTAQARAWRAIVSCRTSALGGQLMRCDGCGTDQGLPRRSRADGAEAGPLK